MLLNYTYDGAHFYTEYGRRWPVSTIEVKFPSAPSFISCAPQQITDYSEIVISRNPRYCLPPDDAPARFIMIKARITYGPLDHNISELALLRELD